MSNANEHRHGDVPEETGTVNGLDRRRFLRASACAIGAAAAPTTLLGASGGDGNAQAQPDAGHSDAHCGDRDVTIHTIDKVPDPVDIEFLVRYAGRDPIRLVGHYWYNMEAVAAGRKCPAIVDINPYRRRDGMIAIDSRMYPWFAYNEYPFGGNPGPRINWLPYVVTHWWDKWLKGIAPPPETTLPPLTVWLGKSREPRSSTGYCDSGRWVAEDADWQARVAETTYYLAPRNRLSPLRARGHDELAGSSRLVFATAMLETSSFGTDGNDDLPGDLAEADRQSLYFDGEELREDLDCFGYPTATLTLACDKPLASIAVRLCEISPKTRASHLVSYTFFNLCHRGGDPAVPQRITPGVPFSVRIPLNLTGHTFRKGWRIRLAISPSFFPTMWQSAEKATITLHTGAFGAFPDSSLVLPGRKPRQADARMKELLPPDGPVLSVYVDDYVPTTPDPNPDPDRNEGYSRDVERITAGGRKGILVRKKTDYGRYLYHGHLQELWVDQVSTENFRMFDDDPLSYTCFTTCKTTLERPQANWHIRATTSTKVWSERDQAGRYWFHYTATVETFIGKGHGGYKPFVQKTVNGSVPRDWV